MKVTFEDDGVSVSIDLPRINIRQEVTKVKGSPAYFGIDPQVEVFGNMVGELYHNIAFGDPAGQRLVLRKDRPDEPGRSLLFEEICRMLVDAEAGKSISFWEDRTTG